MGDSVAIMDMDSVAIMGDNVAIMGDSVAIMGDSVAIKGDSVAIMEIVYTISIRQTPLSP